MNDKSIIITAGGIGKRMQTSIPKQFLLLNNKPILMRTIEQFFNVDTTIQIIVVLPKNQIDYWKSLCLKHEFTIKHTLIEGGQERFYSVKNGLKIAKGKLIGVHDAVRPLVAKDVIENCFKKAKINGAAVPVCDMVESIRKTENKNSIAVNRADYKLVQTPQCFNAEVLKKAYQTDYLECFTDDASVVEAMGHKIYLIQGNKENIKITLPIDLKLAEILHHEK